MPEPHSIFGIMSRPGRRLHFEWHFPTVNSDARCLFMSEICYTLDIVQQKYSRWDFIVKMFSQMAFSSFLLNFRDRRRFHDVD